MKNRICLILPYVGKFHNYFELFLHSIYRNKDILDLLILIPDKHTPELKTEVNFQVPENVFVKEVNFIEAQQLFEEKLSELFEIKVDLFNNEKFSIIKKPYNLCHYRGMFNLWCKDFLKDYSHWGWTDCDLILGNVLDFYPNALELHCVTGVGHFNFLQNIELPELAFGKGYTDWDWMSQRYQAAYDFFCDNSNDYFTGDEVWLIRTFRAYYNKLNHKTVGKDIGSADIMITPGMTLHQFEYKGMNPQKMSEMQLLQKFVYNDGSLYAIFKQTNQIKKLMYVHLMRRTHLCKNNIKVINYDEVLNFEIFPPLTFEEKKTV